MGICMEPLNAYSTAILYFLDNCNIKGLTLNASVLPNGCSCQVM